MARLVTVKVVKADDLQSFINVELPKASVELVSICVLVEISFQFFRNSL